jgi:hypothetical protein
LRGPLYCNEPTSWSEKYHKRSSNIWNCVACVKGVQQGHAGTTKRAERIKATKPMEDKDTWQAASLTPEPITMSVKATAHDRAKYLLTIA